MHNSALINLHTAFYASKFHIKRIFYSSSACMYPSYNQTDPDNPNCTEDSAYPASPDSEYGWEKLFSERLFLAFARNKKLDVPSQLRAAHVELDDVVFSPENCGIL